MSAKPAEREPSRGSRFGHLVLVLAMAAIVLFLPALAAAQPPPPGDQGGGSPEPIAALLLAAGAIPTYVVYRKVFPRR